jgi:Gas vesicle protein
MSMQARGVAVPRETTTLADLLDRVLDKGLVVAGDISVSLANVELLTIRIRLLVCSIDKAEQIGLNWWKYDRSLTGRDSDDPTAIGRLEKRIAELERELERSRKPGR